MEVHEAIIRRRAYRSLEAAEVTEELASDLAEHASLAPSCFNHQPWRYDFVFGKEKLEGVKSSLSKGNEWAHAASMIIAVYSSVDYDCDLKGREYFLFDTGLSVGIMLLRATELGLVAHPIAGYDEDAAKKALGIGDDMTLITLIIVGRKSEEISGALSEKQAEAEGERPERLPLNDIARFID
jgi:nitroreductase